MGGSSLSVLGISGSLRRDSHNTALLRVAAELLPPPAELVLFDSLKAVPPYDADDDEGRGPAGARRFRDAISSADAILIASPEYNHSIPGQLKNALDWASRPFPDNVLRGKPVAVIGASTGMFGAVWSQAEVRKVLGAAGANVIETELPVPHADDAFTEDGRLVDPALRDRLEDTLGDLVSQADRLAESHSVAA
jgi:chromate reductase